MAVKGQLKWSDVMDDGLKDEKKRGRDEEKRKWKHKKKTIKPEGWVRPKKVRKRKSWELE